MKELTRKKFIKEVDIRFEELLNYWYDHIEYTVDSPQKKPEVFYYEMVEYLLSLLSLVFKLLSKKD